MTQESFHRQPRPLIERWLAYGVPLLALPALIWSIWTLAGLITIPTRVADRFFPDTWPSEFGTASSPAETFTTMWCFHEHQTLPDNTLTIERYGLLSERNGQLERYRIFEDFSNRGFDDDAETRFQEVATAVDCTFELTRSRENLLRYGGIALLMLVAAGFGAIGGQQFSTRPTQAKLLLAGMMVASGMAFLLVQHVLPLLPAGGGILWGVRVAMASKNRVIRG